MAKTRTPEQRKRMSDAQKRRFERERINGDNNRTGLTVVKIVQANTLCLKLLDCVPYKLAAELLESLEGIRNG